MDQHNTCPNGHGEGRFFNGNIEVEHHGKTLVIYVEKYICDICGIEWATREQTGNIQHAIKEAYAEKVNA